MYREKSFASDLPHLVFVPTPIGNLEDMTFRAIKELQNADVIFAEDTRVTKKLLDHFEIVKPLRSFHEHNKTSSTEEVLSHLRKNEVVALVSDAGMPIISDPGFELTEAVRSEGFIVYALPGSNALLTALVSSGIRAIPFSFLGFLDSKKSKRLEEITNLQYKTETLIFYEAPHRIEEVLEDFYSVFGSRKACIARELTKLHEEIIVGDLSELQHLENIKGEIVLIIEGYSSALVKSNLSIVEQVDLFIEEGYKKTEAMKKVSVLSGIPKNKIYQEYLDNQEKK